MFPDNLRRDVALARSELIQTSSYRILVDLTPSGLEDPGTTFKSTSVVTFTARDSGRLHIDLIGSTVEAASLDGTDLDPGAFAESRFPLEVSAGDHELSIASVMRYSRSGAGLHRFVDPADDRVYLYTQFEVSDARRVYACFEQPDLKARMQISVVAPQSWTVISNGADVKRTENEPGFDRWEFSETEPISTYLTGIVAGEYATVSSPTPYYGVDGEIPMSILCRQSVLEHLDSDRIFATTRGGFDVFEADFGYPYPFGKYDQAFVPEYNMGAMENVGCVTLRDEYLFRSRMTAASYDGRDNTILHELAHMWFGDLVTMKWWDDLWLKESFAEWASHFAQSIADDDPWHAWATFCNARKTWAYRQDQLPSTHPIAADMVDLEAVEVNFDGITYAKGASVLRQLVAYVGSDDFLAGVRRYFAAHAFGNTQLVDLLTELEQASGRDLSGWSGEWLEQAGVNTLKAEFGTDSEGRFDAFTVSQTAPAEWPTLRSHRIAIGLYNLQGGTLQRVERIETDITGDSTAVPELVGLAQPDLLLVNDDDLTYAKVRLDPRSLRTVVDQVHAIASPLARAVCWGAAWDMCRDAEMPARDYVSLVLRGVVVESDLTAVGAILRQGLAAARTYTHPEIRDEVESTWETGLADLLAEAEPGSDHQVALAKSYPLAVRSAAGAARLQAWLAGEQVPSGLEIDTDLRWLVLTALARLGVADEAAIQAEYARDTTITGAENAAGARAARPTAEAKAEAWRLAVTENTIPNATQRSICAAFSQPGQDDVLAPYLEQYLTAADDIAAARGVWEVKTTSLRDNVLSMLFPQLADTQQVVDRIDRWLPQAELTDPVRRLVSERRDDAVRALRCQEASRKASQ
ncbi:MAG: Membrane alanine aminopeptidase N [uncultured Propionibacteriaceae bacterium]|uniref:Aminopeptidase N n=1 Tax=uncultured Propionibacteriaceae bacterium TaxID=257457 RepID=A0A6J4N1S1_9ACTN|nr:MAG: Membrane alanine aminopeptidase N [uncultured Propionibacteriaceae bacterium]